MTHRSDISLQLVTVTQDDVDSMLDRYDSGMFDVSTANAIALALKRLLRSGQRIQLLRNPANRECSIGIDDYQVELPRELYAWLEKAEQASPVDRVSFWVPLPRDMLAETHAEAEGRCPGRADMVPLLA